MKHTTDPAAASNSPRLLPWPSPDGNPCYLMTDSGGGYVSRLADDLEAVQLAMGADVLGLARNVLDDPVSPYTEVRYAGLRPATRPGCPLPFRARCGARHERPGRPGVPPRHERTASRRSRGPAGGVRVTWRWEYDPDEEHVIGGAPPAFVAEVEKKADELVRAASAFYLDGTG